MGSPLKNLKLDKLKTINKKQNKIEIESLN